MAENTSPSNFAQGVMDGFVRLGTLKEIITIPVAAMIEAQKSANADYLDYLNKVMLDEKGMARTITFAYSIATGAEDGSKSKYLSVPLLAVLTHPNIGVSETKVDFSIQVNENGSVDTKEDSSTDINNGLFAAKDGVGESKRFSLTRSEERKRSTETAATLKFSAVLDRIPVPEALQKVIDAMLA
jgi:hypothetical protein